MLSSPNRKQEQRNRNRQSAQAHRDRQKALMSSLTSRLTSLQAENDILRRELARRDIVASCNIGVPMASDPHYITPSDLADSPQFIPANNFQCPPTICTQMGQRRRTRNYDTISNSEFLQIDNPLPFYTPYSSVESLPSVNVQYSSVESLPSVNVQYSSVESLPSVNVQYSSVESLPSVNVPYSSVAVNVPYSSFAVNVPFSSIESLSSVNVPYSPLNISPMDLSPPIASIQAPKAGNKAALLWSGLAWVAAVSLGLFGLCVPEPIVIGTRNKNFNSPAPVESNNCVDESQVDDWMFPDLSIIPSVEANTNPWDNPSLDYSERYAVSIPATTLIGTTLNLDRSKFNFHMRQVVEFLERSAREAKGLGGEVQLIISRTNLRRL